MSPDLDFTLFNTMLAASMAALFFVGMGAVAVAMIDKTKRDGGRAPWFLYFWAAVPFVVFGIAMLSVG